MRIICHSMPPTSSAAASAANPSMSGWFGTCSHSHAPRRHVTSDAAKPMRTPRTRPGRWVLRRYAAMTPTIRKDSRPSRNVTSSACNMKVKFNITRPAPIAILLSVMNVDRGGNVLSG